MDTSTDNNYSLLWLAVASLSVGLLLLPAALFWSTEPHQQLPIIIIALGFLLLGTGEILNHPLQKGLKFTDKDKSRLIRFQHRHRNSCALGNLLIIGSLLCLFIGLGKFFSPY